MFNSDLFKGCVTILLGDGSQNPTGAEVALGPLDFGNYGIWVEIWLGNESGGAQIDSSAITDLVFAGRLKVPGSQNGGYCLGNSDPLPFTEFYQRTNGDDVGTAILMVHRTLEVPQGGILIFHGANTTGAPEVLFRVIVHPLS